MVCLFANRRYAKFYCFLVHQEHTIVDSKPDHFLDDLRLNNPWPELKKYTALISSLIILFWHPLTVVVDGRLSDV